MRFRVVDESDNPSPRQPAPPGRPHDDDRAAAPRGRAARRRASSVRVFGICAGAACLISLAYLAGAALLLPPYLRGAAASAGLELDFSSIRSLYPGELRVIDPELAAPGGDASLHARELHARLPWRSLLSSEPGTGVARAHGAALEWTKGYLGPFEVKLRLRTQPSGSGRAGWLAIDGKQTTLRAPKAALEFALRARLEVYHWSTDSGALHVELGEGTIEASHIALERAPSDPAERGAERSDLHAILRVDAGTVFEGHDFSLLGRAHAQGGDASVGFAWLGVDDTVRWMLSDLVNQPFQLEATTRICGQGLDLEDIRLSSGVTLAAGALHTDGESWRGAISLRRGSLVLGISVRPSGATAAISPEPYWLASELARLPNVCADTVL